MPGVKQLSKEENELGWNGNVTESTEYGGGSESDVALSDSLFSPGFGWV